MRQHACPTIVPLYAGYVAWRAMLPESALPPAIHRDLFDAMTFCLPPGEQFLGYPVAGPDNDLRPGQRRYNVIWYRPADEANELPWLLTDDSGVMHSISIPPPLIRREADRRHARGGGAAAGAAISRDRAADRRAAAAADLRSGQPAARLRPGRAGRRCGFCGAPACRAPACPKPPTMRRRWPQALDAEDDIEAALRRYEAERLPENNRIIERARHLGAYLQATQSAEERTRSARHGIPEAVLAETAMLDFLYV